MKILGIGVLFNRGRGIGAFRQALRQGWQAPGSVSEKDRVHRAYLVPSESIQDRDLLRGMRRADRLSKMAVLAAGDALADSGLNAGIRRRTGIIVATAFGAHVMTFDFLDGILDYGEAAVSPTVFSNSVHNAAASYIATALEIQGPTLTATRFFFSFQAALQLADAWLREGRVEHVLVGAVDQFGDVMGYLAHAKLTLSPDGRIRPFQLKAAGAVPGEGAAFFLLGREGIERAYCTVAGVRFGDDLGEQGQTDLTILDADGMLTDESVYVSSLAPGTPLAAYSPLYGSMMIGSAFSCAAGALTLRDRNRYPNPVLDNPQGLSLLREEVASSIEFIRCIRYNCFAEKAVLYLKRT